jgi:uncharacterized protein
MPKYDDITFVIYKDAKGEFRWRLRGKNWEILADSGEGYVRHESCLYAINLIQAEAGRSSIIDQTKK